MNIICLDLEGVLVPEIWIDFADLTGIDALRATTRDIADYDELMQMRLAELDRHNLGLRDIEAVIDRMAPLDGALTFLDGLRARYQVIILSDTFYEFARPLMRQLNWPTLFCHTLETDEHGRISGYQLRMPDHKRAAVEAFRQLNFNVAAAGDSYNDTGMLGAAHHGFLFNAPDNVIRDFPDFPVMGDYAALSEAISDRLDQS
ncbi:bifunctional phosphoserine phosphatase/homoserine phosphotransferase ThrH [Spiribacter sp. 2438]|uniref:bifunctional phosphoserine phosphatase/homoserine phosphotransferase ThrH n=1 Tax=Spiribacter sp. 2438 TaxID=2666185 RepID=UPI0012B0A966|nr:bifunctional phosphoserine phosphatase/homoserine phosphotransferase ThrH [Spiribacter sp. 2438]QGM21933.1 bifunctional phosphoserine phosphatase/homoserine phosphotransferase ThrH [Spiribacter sp. 2438]